MFLKQKIVFCERIEKSVGAFWWLLLLALRSDLREVFWEVFWALFGLFWLICFFNFLKS
jgi:hypothetical protein